MNPDPRARLDSGNETLLTNFRMQQTAILSERFTVFRFVNGKGWFAFRKTLKKPKRMTNRCGTGMVQVQYLSTFLYRYLYCK
jgi:hypothetical protein